MLERPGGQQTPEGRRGGGGREGGGVRGHGKLVSRVVREFTKDKEEFERQGRSGNGHNSWATAGHVDSDRSSHAPA